MSKPTILTMILALVLAGCGAGEPAAEVETTSQEDADADVAILRAMLNEFLAGASVGDPAAHDRFWSEDLVYTSSSGTRRGKAEIMEGLSGADTGDSAPSVVYTAEEVEVDLYGTTAVVAFRLVATPVEGSEDSTVSHYFNTGTFLKRHNRWQVVAWQATRIPEAAPESTH